MGLLEKRYRRTNQPTHEQGVSGSRIVNICQVLWAPLAKETQVCHVEKLTVRRKVAQPLVLSTLAKRKQHQKVSGSMFPFFEDKHITFPRREQE